MKTKQKELDVDIIGNQDPLTDSEEKTLNEFFKQKKELNKLRTYRLKRSTRRVSTES